MQKMNKYNAKIDVIQSDNVYMQSIKSTRDGRIFLAGKDGCLYEIIYQVIHYVK